MTGKIVWAYVTYIGMGMLYTLVGLPFLSLMSVSTQDIGERSSLSAFRSWGSQIGVLFATGTMMMLVGFFGGGDMGKGFQLTMILFASVAAVLYICLGLFTKERASVPDKQKLKLKEGIKLLFTNKPWIVLNVFFVLFFLYIMTRNAFGIFALVVMKFYTLNEATFENIMADLKSRKEADEPAAEDGTKVKVAFSESNA